MKLFVREKSFYKTFFTLTVTIALQNLIVYSVSFADNVMLGAFSEEALSGVALVNQIQFLLQMLTMGIGEGIVVLASQYWGQKDTDSIKKIMNGGLLLGVILAAVLWAVVFFAPHQVLRLFTDDEAVIAEGMKYLEIICFSYFFFCMTNILICSLRSVETVRIGFLISLSTLVINVCLNYLFIFGNFGAPRLGAAGAAIATLAARIVEFAIMICYLKFFDQKLRIRWKDLLLFDKRLFTQYVKVGSPVIAANGIWGIAMAVQTAILGHLGANAIAANSVATTVFQVLMVFATGSASASAVITGKTIGEGKIEAVKQYAVTFQILFLIIGVLTGLALFLSRGFVLGFYSISEESRAMADEFMIVLSITSVGTSYQMPCLTGIVRGGGDTNFVFINDMIFIWGFVTPMAALAAFVFHWPPVVVFIFLKSDQVLKCFVAIPKVNRFQWIRRLAEPEAEPETVTV